MKQGELIGDYLISSKPTNANGGKCLWAFAAKDGQEFFIKQFLDPKYPLDSAPGGAASKKLRRQDCAVFEQRHQHVMERLKSDSVGGGNIVVAEAFFRDGATYYKVTKRIDASNLESLRSLTEHQKAVVLRTLGLSLQQLHRIGIVHGDLKPDNVLVQKRSGHDLYTAKLIDFDDSYLAGQPPEPTAVGGDGHYGAPEWHAYIQEESRSDGSELTTAVDMFALGLMLHEYLTGQLPGYPGDFPSPGEAVKAGRPLTPDPQLHPDMTRLVIALTHGSPQRRLASRTSCAPWTTSRSSNCPARMPRPLSGRWRRPSAAAAADCISTWARATKVQAGPRPTGHTAARPEKKARGHRLAAAAKTVPPRQPSRAGPRFHFDS